MLHIHTSNNLEYLIQALATVISSKPSSPFVPEIIVVQSKGMERWVSMELARQLGAFANGSFPFPNTMLWRAFKETLGHLPDTSPFEREVMVWSLMDMEKRLFSFSTEYCTASTVLLNERQEATAFISEPLPQPLAEWKTVDINRLTRFFKNGGQLPHGQIGDYSNFYRLHTIEHNITG